MKDEQYTQINEAKYSDGYWQVDRSKNKWFSKFVKAKILEKWITQLKNKGVLLDAGGGTGNWAAYFKDYFSKTIVLDISKKALNLIPEKDIIKKRGSLLKIPLKDNYIDCILLVDVFEHIANEDLPKLLSELRRILKGDGSILILTNQYGYAINLLSVRFFNKKGRLTKADVDDGHLNRLYFSEIKTLIRKNGLVLADFYHYSIFFQQATDFLKDCSTKIMSKVLGRSKREFRAGQSIKEDVKQGKTNPLLYCIFYILSVISYLDIILFGKRLPGSAIFLNLKKA